MKDNDPSFMQHLKKVREGISWNFVTSTKFIQLTRGIFMKKTNFFQNFFSINVCIVWNWKQCEIYRRMCMEKQILVKIIFKKRAKHTFATTSPIWGVHGLSSNEKILGIAVNKDCHTDSLLKHKRTHVYWFPLKKKKKKKKKKSATVNWQCFRHNSPK